MQLGWVDFSKSERDKALEILRLLTEPEAIDEIGIGVVRDAFADAMFPGTSTLLTRAKYFLIVPYIVREAVADVSMKPSEALAWIVNEERKVAKRLYELHKSERNSGIIGQVALAHGKWVKRSPSELYWNGIRRFGICEEREMSLPQYVEAALSVAKAKGTGLGRVAKDEEDDADDLDAGGWMRLKPLDIATIYRKGWRSDVDIDLTKAESEYLEQKILRNASDTILACALRDRVRIDSYHGDFSAFSLDMERHEISPYNRQLLTLAREFSSLVRAARVRYNVILQGNKWNSAAELWKDVDVDKLRNSPKLVEDVFVLLGMEEKNSHYARTMRFLRDLSAAFAAKDIARADRLIKDREISIKGRARAKLTNASKYSSGKIIGGEYLDYRLNDVGGILKDIYIGLGVKHV